jgi:hypothetical protein
MILFTKGVTFVKSLNVPLCSVVGRVVDRSIQVREISLGNREEKTLQVLGVE